MIKSVFSFRRKIILIFSGLVVGFVVLTVKIFLRILRFAGRRAHVTASLHVVVVVVFDDDDADTNLETKFPNSRIKF